MKIFYLGKFEAFHATENYVSHALRELGHEVVQFDFKEGVGIQDIIGRLGGVDLFLVSKVKYIGMRRLLKECERRGIKTVCWVWDMFWGYRPCLAQFDAQYLLTTDGGHQKKWDLKHTHHRVLRQGIHAPDHLMFEDEPEHDVAFVGSHYGHESRRKLLFWLHEEYGERFIWHKDTRGQELNRALARVKVVVGDSYPSKNYWSNRIYEITGRGGFLLHPETEGLDAEFVDGHHYVSYRRNDFDQLRDIVERYVEDDEEREAIKLAGFGHCGANYTYQHRVVDMLDIVANNEPHLVL